jgi:hypothetical protein
MEIEGGSLIRDFIFISFIAGFAFVGVATLLYSIFEITKGDK